MSTETPSRRRRPTGKANGEKKAETTAPVAENAESQAVETPQEPSKPRRPRIEPVPVPAELEGQTVTGIIYDLIRIAPNKLPSFGFIMLGETAGSPETTPRIYFGRKEFSDEVHRFPRKGYVVTFTVTKDEQGRFAATGIKLNDAGRVVADAQKAEYDAKKAAAKAAAPAAVTPAPVTPPAPATTEEPVAAAEKTKKPKKKNNKPRETVSLNLKISVEGHPDTKDVEVKLNRQLGQLKRDVMKIFATSGKFEMLHVTEENKEGTFLTGAVLKTLKNDDRVHFKLVKEEEASA